MDVAYTPDQFCVNQAWIALRVNEQFLLVQDEPYDIYVLLDAASAFVFGHVLLRVVDEAPPEKDIKELFLAAWGTKSQWAEELIVTEQSAADEAFVKEAEKNGLAVRIISLSELEPIVGPLKESFALCFSGREAKSGSTD